MTDENSRPRVYAGCNCVTPETSLDLTNDLTGPRAWAMDHRVVLLGTSLTTASVGAALADVPGLALFPVEFPRDDAATWVDALKPDVVLFDLAAGFPDSALRHFATCADLALIGFDLETRKMLLLSGEPASLLTTDDLVRAVKKLAAVANLVESG